MPQPLNLPRADVRPAQTILVVDDDPVTRAIARKFLAQDGYRILEAADGETGLALFKDQAPDLVLTDFSMPGMSGADLTRAIQKYLKEHYDGLAVYVPIVILTSLGQPEILKQALEAGAVEFLMKPFTGPELRTRVHAIAQAAATHAALLVREAEEQDEIVVLKLLLDRLVEPGRASLPEGFLMETLATNRINGDVCAHHAGAPGIHFGLLCDPMGHGLIAGISEIPTMDAFNALAGIDLPLAGILSGINLKLFQLLTRDRFSCVLLFRLDRHTGSLSVLNAGMPDAMVFHRDGNLTRFTSTSIPLGILEDLGSLSVEHRHLEAGDCLFGCSDGLTDLVPEPELVAAFRTGGAAGFPGRLRALLDQRLRDRELADDVSWCLWPYLPDALGQAPPPGPTELTDGSVPSLSLRLRFFPTAQTYDELAPNLAAFLASQGAPGSVTQTMAVVLSEAIMNAVDHGLLGLDSALKTSFETFEAERGTRLGADPQGAVDLLAVVHRAAGGSFSHVWIQVTDPGQGFDWRSQLADRGDPAALFHGRGLTLIRALARDLSFNDAGNVISFSVYPA
jgi:CheY-like chemotaxis protein/anti-sigma regulatory factor (Ser/Thr protein kinase)